MAVNGSDGQEFCNDTTDICSARDPEGHGTHTMTTAAGDCVNSAVLYGVDRGPVCGIAPGAHVIEYRVCLAQGCFSSDSVDAVEQAILDGVNVINFSISGGARSVHRPGRARVPRRVPRRDLRQRVGRQQRPGRRAPPTTAGRGSPPSGASTGPRSFTLDAAPDGRRRRDARQSARASRSRTASRPPTPVVLAQNIPGEDALCQSKLAAGSAADRQDRRCASAARTPASTRASTSSSGGAAGMILYNPIAEDTETDNHWLPAIHVDGPDTALLAFVNGHTNVKASVGAGHGDADARRRDGRVLVARPAGRLHQAGRHRSGRPGARGHDPAARRDDADQRPARQQLPGDRRHVDGEPARRRRLGARQGRRIPTGLRPRSSRR